MPTTKNQFTPPVVVLSATVIKETNVIEGTPCSAWFVWHDGKPHGQFMSEQGAIPFAIRCLTDVCIKSGTPIDQDNIRRAITFEQDTANDRAALALAQKEN